MNLMGRSLTVIFALSGIGCSDVTAPKQIPLQFQSSTMFPVVESVTITSQPSALRIAGSYMGAGCGAVGAVAVLEGPTLRLTVGPRREVGACDASLVGYAYTATLLNLEKGQYAVEVFHRTNGDENAKLAGHQDITID